MNRLLAPAAALTTALVLSGCGPSLYNVARGRGELGCIGLIWAILAVLGLINLFNDSKRDSTSKLIWALVIVFVPVGLGAILYYFFGKKG